MPDLITLGHPDLPATMTLRFEQKLSLGKHVEELEKKWPVQGEHRIACANGTSALAIAIKAAVKTVCGKAYPRNLVVCSSYTFGATVLAIRQAGYYPVFADCDDLGLLSFESVYRLLDIDHIGSKIAAVVGTNAFGLPVNSLDIDVFRQRHKDIPVILDNAQGVGAVITDRLAPASSKANVETYSMSPTKVVTASEGGMIVTDDHRIAALCRSGRLYGRNYDGCASEVDTYNGMSARMSDVCAQVGLFSLDFLEHNLHLRMKIIQEYNRQHLNMLPTLYQSGHYTFVSGLNYAVTLLPPGISIKYVMAMMLKAGIETRNYFLSQGTGSDNPCAARLSARSLALPLHTRMTHGQVIYIADVLKGILKDESHPGANDVR